MKREYYWVRYTAMSMLRAWGVADPTLPAKGERMIILFPSVLQDGTAPTFKHAEIVWSDKRNDCGERLWHCVASDEVPDDDHLSLEGYEDDEIVVHSFTKEETAIMKQNNIGETPVVVPRMRYRINTGCPYDRGQRITVVIDPAKGAYFVDHSRNIDGEVLGKGRTLRYVIAAYLLNTYENSRCPEWLTTKERVALVNERDLPDTAFEDWSAEYRRQMELGWRLV